MIREVFNADCMRGQIHLQVGTSVYVGSTLLQHFFIDFGMNPKTNVKYQKTKLRCPCAWQKSSGPDSKAEHGMERAKTA